MKTNIVEIYKSRIQEEIFKSSIQETRYKRSYARRADIEDQIHKSIYRDGNMRVDTSRGHVIKHIMNVQVRWIRLPFVQQKHIHDL